MTFGWGLLPRCRSTRRESGAASSIFRAPPRPRFPGDPRVGHRGREPLLVAVAASGLAFPLVLAALFKSFGLVQAGGVRRLSPSPQVTTLSAPPSQSACVSAPVAGPDGGRLLLGLISRRPQAYPDTGAPVAILPGRGGWLTIGLLAERLLNLVVDSGTAIETIATDR